MSYCPPPAVSRSVNPVTASTPCSSTTSCSPCVAIISFLLGAIGGFFLSVALNNSHSTSSLSPSSSREQQQQQQLDQQETCTDPTGRNKNAENIVSKEEGDIATQPFTDKEPSEKQKTKPVELSSSADNDKEDRGIVILEGEDDDDDDSENIPAKKGGQTPVAAHGKQQQQQEEDEEQSMEKSTKARAGGNAKNKKNEGDNKSIRIIVQRFRSASLLLSPPTSDSKGIVAHVGNTKSFSDSSSLLLADPATITTSSSPSSSSSSLSSSSGGIVIYISFAQTAEEGMLYDAALTILNLPILTRGLWGDGSGTISVLQMASELANEKSAEDEKEQRGGEGVAVMIVPQANLISKVKGQGKSIQYHGQIAKSRGEALYHKFVDIVKLIALEHQYKVQEKGKALPESVQRALESLRGEGGVGEQKDQGSLAVEGGGTDASIPPERMFLNESLYSSWDDAGFPLTDSSGEPMTKSARKKMKKLYAAQKKRHEKFNLSVSTSGDGDGILDSSECDKGGDGAVDAAEIPTTSEKGQSATKERVIVEDVLPDLDSTFIHVVGGTFGNRQGMEFCSDMGPFCHVLNLG